MSTDLDLPTLDALHARCTPGKWEAWCGSGWPREWASLTGISDEEVVWPIRSEGAGESAEPLCVALSAADQEFIAATHNAYPALSARIRDLEASESTLLHDAWKYEQRIVLLTETLRGIRQEKADELLDCTSPGTRGTLEGEIAWIDRVLRGEK